MDDDTDTLSCSGASVALCMDIVSWMPFLMMTSVWTLTVMIGKGPLVFGINSLFVVVVLYLSSLVEEAVDGGLSTQTSCPAANTGVLLKLLP